MAFRIERGVFKIKRNNKFVKAFDFDAEGKLKATDADGNITEDYLTVSGKAADANRLDGLDSSAFARTTELNAPAAPSLVSKASKQDTIQFTFNQSSGADYYEIWSSVGNNTDFGLVGKVDPSSVSSTMTFTDATFNTNSGTIYYRVYGIQKGIYSSPLEFNHSFSWSAPAISIKASSVLDFILLSWEPVESRLVKGYRIKHHATSGTPSSSSATTIATTANSTFAYSVPAGELNLNHEFFIEPVY